MADISITRTHQFSHAKAKEAAQKVADKMAEKFDMTIAWQGQVLSFNGPGVTGTLSVHKNEALIEVTLGPLLKFFEGKIREKITQNMNQVFGNAA